MAKLPGFRPDPVTGNWTIRVVLGQSNFKQSTGTPVHDDAEPLYHVVMAEFKTRIREALSAENAEHRKHALDRLAERWFAPGFPLSRREAAREYYAANYNADDYDPRNEWVLFDDDCLYTFAALEDLNRSVTRFAQASGMNLDAEVQETPRHHALGQARGQDARL